jgi:CheY-like chemotaxis protein
VEDDSININFGTSLLRKLGFDFITVENGRDCLTVLDQGKFDVVLMDIKMPIMTGSEALREIRRKELDSNCHQPVIALTGYSMRGDKGQLIDEGFDGYISKPFKSKELIAEIKRVLAGR